MIKVFPLVVVEIKDPTEDQVLKVNGHRLKLMLELTSEEDMVCIFHDKPPPSQWSCFESLYKCA